MPLFKEKDRRSILPFQEWLSKFMVRTAAMGAAYVLVDPKLTCSDVVQNLTCALVMGSGTFSLDTKGLVIAAILIGGYNSIREFWLGTSKGGQEAAARLADAVVPPTPPVAPLVKGPEKADTVTATGDVVVKAEGNVTVNAEEGEKK